MKITKIETLVCHARMRNWIFVKVLTDQPGLYGWGEATLEWHTRGVVGAIEDLRQLLIGEDPTRVEHLWQMMYRQHFWHGNGIVRGTAISGIDIALWDIVGKVHNMPCHKLWGGPVRDYVRLYSHLGGGKMEDFYETDPADAKRFGDLAAKAVEEGFTAFKSMAVPIDHAAGRLAADSLRRGVRGGDARRGRRFDRHHGRLPRPAEPAHGIALRQGAGAVQPLLVRRTVLAGDDGGHRADPARGENADRDRRAPRRRPSPFANCSKSAPPASSSPTSPIAADSPKPDEIAAMAEAYRVALAPHNPQGPVSTAASLELGFATPSYIICETGAFRRAVAEGCGEGRIRRRSTRAESFARTTSRASESKSTRMKCASIPSSRKSCSASFTKTAASGIGNGRTHRTGGDHQRRARRHRAGDRAGTRSPRRSIALGDLRRKATLHPCSNPSAIRRCCRDMTRSMWLIPSRLRNGCRPSKAILVHRR